MHHSIDVFNSHVQASRGNVISTGAHKFICVCMN